MRKALIPQARVALIKSNTFITRCFSLPGNRRASPFTRLTGIADFDLMVTKKFPCNFFYSHFGWLPSEKIVNA